MRTSGIRVAAQVPTQSASVETAFPVVALIHEFMDHAADARSRDAVLGPPLCRIYRRFALGPL
jgi:hypothetical protein